MNHPAPSLFRPLALTALLALTACGGDDAPDDSPGTPDEEGCEHLQSGPSTAVTASLGESTAPDISEPHRRYDLSFPGATGSKEGMVKFAASNAGTHFFFFNKDVPVTVFPADVGSVATTSTRSSTACTDVALRLVAPLEVGTYILKFGPMSEAAVQLVAVPEAGASEGHGE